MRACFIDEKLITTFSIAVCRFVPMVSTIKSQDSRAIQTQSKECIWKSRTGIDAPATIIVAVVSLCGVAHAHGHMNMLLHKWSSSIAASTTIAAASSMLSGHVTHLTTWREVAIYGVKTKDAAGLAALHVVCTNRVALLQAMQEDASSNDHEQSRLLWRYEALPR